MSGLFSVRAVKYFAVIRVVYCSACSKINDDDDYNIIIMKQCSIIRTLASYG